MRLLVIFQHNFYLVVLFLFVNLFNFSVSITGLVTVDSFISFTITAIFNWMFF